tara:strand:+ start:16 stop:252 length:237 start_codon:yes stop_codon:yes gene_type:complete
MIEDRIIKFNIVKDLNVFGLAGLIGLDVDECTGIFGVEGFGDFVVAKSLVATKCGTYLMKTASNQDNETVSYGYELIL